MNQYQRQYRTKEELYLALDEEIEEDDLAAFKYLSVPFLNTKQHQSIETTLELCQALESIVTTQAGIPTVHFIVELLFHIGRRDLLAKTSCWDSESIIRRIELQSGGLVDKTRITFHRTAGEVTSKLLDKLKYMAHKFPSLSGAKIDSVTTAHALWTLLERSGHVTTTSQLEEFISPLNAPSLMKHIESTSPCPSVSSAKQGSIPHPPPYSELPWSGASKGTDQFTLMTAPGGCEFEPGHYQPTACKRPEPSAQDHHWGDLPQGREIDVPPPPPYSPPAYYDSIDPVGEEDEEYGAVLVPSAAHPQESPQTLEVVEFPESAGLEPADSPVWERDNLNDPTPSHHARIEPTTLATEMSYPSRHFSYGLIDSGSSTQSHSTGTGTDSMSGLDFPSYPMVHRPRGICIIINNMTFGSDVQDEKPLGKRKGSEKDTEKIIGTFSRLGFVCYLYNDLDTDAMLVLLTEASRLNHTRTDAFVCVIMSHGKQDAVYGTNGKTVTVDSLKCMFKPNVCPTLMGKPKMFFIQACQGKHKIPCVQPFAELHGDISGQTELDNPESTSSNFCEDIGSGQPSSETPSFKVELPLNARSFPHGGSSPDTNTNWRAGRENGHIWPSSVTVPEGAVMSQFEPLLDHCEGLLEVDGGASVPNEADFLVGYATAPGYVSFRSTNHGAWYMRCLSQELDKYGLRHDLLSILTKVNQEVSKKNADMDNAIYKQVPAPQHTLRMKVCFGGRGDSAV